MKNITSIVLIGFLIISGFGTSVISIRITPLYQFSSIDKYDMVIISPEIFSDEIQILIDHKNSVGIKTFLKTTEEIYNEYQGRDETEQIKYFIKDALETQKIKHVFLIGDIDKVPVRKSWVRFSYGSELMYENCITDLYYADIYDSNGSFCSWDSNNNNKFGETIQDVGFYDQTFEYIDDVDLYPDTSIGRLPCSKIDEINKVIDKIINYETQTNGKEWFNRLILMGGDTFPYKYGWSYPGCEINEGENVTDYIGDNLDGFKSIKLWTSLRTFKPFKINREVNKGAGFISYSGHGSEYGIGTSMPNSSRYIHYDLLWIYGLRNEQKLPVVYLSACLTAKFDCTVENLQNTTSNPISTYICTFLAGVPNDKDCYYPCFAWQLVKKESGGAIAVIGSTNRCLAGEAGDFINTGTERLMVQFFLSYEPGITVGEMFLKSKQDYMNNAFPLINECVNMELHTLIGDPSLRVGGYP